MTRKKRTQVDCNSDGRAVGKEGGVEEMGKGGREEGVVSIGRIGKTDR